MPHIIVEYSTNLENQIDIPAMLDDMHDALANEGVDKGRIKTRALPLPHVVVGNQGQEGHMVHITLLLLEGRDTQTKKTYATPIHSIAKKVAPEECAVTLEVRDMISETYIL